MATITYLTRIEFGAGEVARLPDHCRALGLRRPLLVTDRGIMATGLADRVAALLPDGTPVYDGTPANPTESAARDGLALFRREACDGIVALGGGSPLDLGKAVRLLTGHDGPLSDYAFVEGGLTRIHGRLPPMIAVPTTAGTGSEVGRAAVIVVADGRKLALISPHMLPSLAICDPDLTSGLPPGLTAATGLDALSHCLETFMAPAYNPPADAIALDGLERGWAAIRRAVEDGSDRAARADMMMCALEGAMAFQKGLGAVHALSHPLGALRAPRLHHGTLNAMLMPGVLRFNREAIGDKWGKLRVMLGDEPDRAVARLNTDLGLPRSLSVLGVDRAMLPGIAAAALVDHCHATNPRRASEADYLALLQEAF